MIYSDESIIRLGAETALNVWRPLGERNNPLYTQTVGRRVTSQKVQIWGFISTMGVGIKKVEGNMDRFKYLSILQELVAPIIEPGAIFLHDRSPIHTAKLIKEYLTTQPIPTIDFPVRSPDLNPIENIWALLKRHVSSMNIKGTDELWVVIQDWWKQMGENQTHIPLVESMPRRIRNCLHTGGDWTKY